MRAFFLRRLLVLHKKWFCECEVERPSSSRPGWGRTGPGVLGDSAVPLHWHRKLGAEAGFWESLIGVFVLLSQAPSREHVRPDWGGGCIWKPLRSPCPLLRGRGALRLWWGLALLESVLVWRSVFLPKRRWFWFSGRMAFGFEKDNQRKMGRLGISFKEL